MGMTRTLCGVDKLSWTAYTSMADLRGVAEGWLEESTRRARRALAAAYIDGSALPLRVDGARYTEAELLAMALRIA